MNMPKKNWLEWAVFAVSFVLVAGTLGYLTYDAATCGDAPPAIEVRLGAPDSRSHNFTVPVTVINHGDRTAEGVHIEVTMAREGAEEESADFEIAFLPRGATREGWVAFQSDPRTAQLTARVLGYEKP